MRGWEKEQLAINQGARNVGGNSRGQIRSWLTACALLLSSSVYGVTFGDGGAALQGTLDAITVAPNAGVSSTDVVGDSLTDTTDSYWQLGAGGTVLNKIGGNTGYSFGIYDAADPANRVSVYSGGESDGTLSTIGMYADGSVLVNFVDTGVDFTGNHVGFYIEMGASVWFSDTALNPDGLDHMTGYQGQDVDTIQIPPYSPGNWGSNEFIFGWEDGADGDYNDFAVIIESITPEPLPEPTTASLGDFVWEDLDGDGIQDANEPGVEGVSVELYNCSDMLIDLQSTGPDGSYLFADLLPGDYYVRFVLPNGYAFTLPNVGSDNLDSDANASGETPCTTLDAGENDNSIDAGLVQPATLGDRTWLDTDNDGFQDATEPDLDGVVVTLYTCGLDGDPGTADDSFVAQTTSANGGMYLFENLAPGNYFVHFQTPAGLQLTSPDQAADDVDSDAGADGRTTCITLLSGDDDRTWDAGFVAPPQAVCDIEVDQTCRIEPPPPSSDYVCSKPIDQLSMIWNGSGDILVNAWKGDVGDDLLADMEPLSPLDELSVSGYAGAPNDVVWEIFDATSGAKIGESVFHLSCSDGDMNGPEDCGKPLGDGKKNKDEFLNDWLLEGMVDKNGSFDCTVTPPEPQLPTGQSCQVTANGQGSYNVTLGYRVTNNGDALSNVILSDDFNNPIAGPITLTSGQSAEFIETVTSSTSFVNRATVNGVLANSESCFDTDDLAFDVIVPPASCDDGKPTSLTFEYTGEACDATNNDQEGKVECDGDPAGAGPIEIVVVKDDSKVGVTPTGEVTGLNGTFTIQRIDGDGAPKPDSSLPSEIKFEIRQDGVTLQSLTIHTSCSKDLNVGDQFGGAVLRVFTPET